MRTWPQFFLLLLFTTTLFASNLQPNQGPVKFRLTATGGEAKDATIDLDLYLKKGSFTGKGTTSSREKLDFGGDVTGYYENGHCILRLEGPNGRTLELRGDCTGETFKGRYESHGRGDYVSGTFEGLNTEAASATRAAKDLHVPTGKLICTYQEHTGGEGYEQRFSKIGSITLTDDGTYTTGSGRKGKYVREGASIKLTSGIWKGYFADLDTDRSGEPKLVFRSVDPGVTSCTSPRK